ncbi:hypothetical protein J6590_069769 [Homalodisca vitripennis]|nr:hypothetical protein J6590_069769 [Homalodisca vitripennis]
MLGTLILVMALKRTEDVRVFTDNAGERSGTLLRSQRIKRAGALKAALGPGEGPRRRRWRVQAAICPIALGGGLGVGTSAWIPVQALFQITRHGAKERTDVSCQYPTFACAGVMCDCDSRTRDLCSGLAFCAVTTLGLDFKQLLSVFEPFSLPSFLLSVLFVCINNLPTLRRR